MSTNIEWTDETWNPVTGCAKVSQGCKHCYAERLWPKVEGARVKREGGAPRPFTHVSTHPDRLEQPLRWRTPRRIFVNSMSDLFHEDVPDAFILQVFDVMRQCENGWTNRVGGERGKLVADHTFQILTKRPARMLDFCARLRFAQNDGRGMYLAESLPHNGFNPMRALPHVWLGVSVEDQATADERIPLLLQTPAAVRFLSCEPLLGPIDIRAWLPWKTRAYEGNTPIDWVIGGGESGPHARPSHPDWFRSLRDHCAAAGVAYFFKQWGEWEEVASEMRDDDGEHFEIDPESAEATDWFDDGDKRNCLLAPDGTAYWYRDKIPLDVKCRLMNRAGKKAAGRELDGRTHDEYPT